MSCADSGRRRRKAVSETPAVRIHDNLAMIGSSAFGISHHLDCNVYAIMDGGEAAIIDAGAGIEPDALAENLASLGPVRLKYILLTHCHADHVCGAPALRAKCGGRIVASEADGVLMERGTDYELGLEQARLSGSYPADYAYTHFTPDIRAEEGSVFDVGGLRVTALIVPGHTPGSTVYLVETGERREVFSGDTALVGGFISLINVPGCDLAAYRESMPRLAGIQADGLYPGHWVWCVRDGQKHIDDIIRQLRRSRPPRNFADLLR